MVKKILLITLLIPFISYSQKVISSTGGFSSNTNGSIEYTLGELAIETFTTGTGAVTQGFHQTGLTVATVDDVENPFAVNLYPNPTSDILKLDISDFFGMRYEIYDLNGRTLLQKDIEAKLSEINVSTISNGLYLLTLYNAENKKVKSYRIIKN